MSSPEKQSRNKDYYGGALLVLIGVSAAYAANSYHLGTLAHMGPGYFPFAIGVLIAICGILLALTAKKQNAGDEAALVGHHHDIPDLRGAFCIILGTILFYFAGEYFGLLPATFCIVFVSALGDRSNSVIQALVLTAAMMIVSVVIFWWALQVQMPLVKWGI
ncbi:tripartite tricarboxylate transporter TctB family protein [Diaphorobacter sp.]|uniref:tripartite tricarboxylate transporter TctB family protein n=1 Tax=Diaphorobacter sp. TaxID=1934310 RepID=UPI0028B25949|nr:tripartite tricarboxylate transporter TctB family protein [Diaphorobacter sp.]